MSSKKDVLSMLREEHEREQQCKKLWETHLKAKGALGEEMALRWLCEDRGIEIDVIPQEKHNKLDFCPWWAKRPDFLGDLDGDGVFFDAKLHSTKKQIEFCLPSSELSAYSEFLKIYYNAPLIFILIPDECRTDLLLIRHEDMVPGFNCRGEAAHGVLLNTLAANSRYNIPAEWETKARDDLVAAKKFQAGDFNPPNC